MADNYIGKKMEEFLSKPATRPTVKVAASLVRLLGKNRSVRGYDPSFRVREDQLHGIAAVAALTPSARNAQPLRFRLVWGEEAAAVTPLVRMGGALPELHLPLAGTEPNAWIVVCTGVEPTPDTYIDLGIVAQSMLLRATEMGLNGLCIRAFDAAGVSRTLDLPAEFRPLMVLAIGRSAERIECVEVGEGEPLQYYRRDGVHYVPKIRAEELLIASKK